jgi:UDP-N-acetyl-D-galactosamine dehydrogenase
MIHGQMQGRFLKNIIYLFIQEDELNFENYSVLMIAVGHYQFMKIDFKIIRNDGFTLYDVKGILNKELVDSRL